MQTRYPGFQHVVPRIHPAVQDIHVPVAVSRARAEFKEISFGAARIAPGADRPMVVLFGRSGGDPCMRASLRVVLRAGGLNTEARQNCQSTNAEKESGAPDDAARIPHDRLPNPNAG